MKWSRITPDEKKVLERLASEFSEDFSKRCKTCKSIGLHGIHDFEVLDFFQGRLKSHLSTQNLYPEIKQNSSEQEYNINLKSFSRESYSEGLNEE